MLPIAALAPCTRGGRCSLAAGRRASPGASTRLAFTEVRATALGNVSAAVAWATENRATARRARVGAVGMTASAIRLWLVACEQIRASRRLGVPPRSAKTIKRAWLRVIETARAGGGNALISG